MNEQKNLILAIVLSAIVFFGWQFLVIDPQKPAPAPPTQEQPSNGEVAQTGPVDPLEPVATGGAELEPAEGAVSGLPRAEALAASQRVTIDSPRLGGSIALTGAVIDDVLFKDYRETVDLESPNIMLFNPTGSRDAYLAKFGWSKQKNIAVPRSDTIWTADRDVLTGGNPAVGLDLEPAHEDAAGGGDEGVGREAVIALVGERLAVPTGCLRTARPGFVAAALAALLLSATLVACTTDKGYIPPSPAGPVAYFHLVGQVIYSRHSLDQSCSIDQKARAAGADQGVRQAAAATALMDEYRRTSCPEVFEGLVRLCWAQLFTRVRSRVRYLAAQLDPNEVLQDAIINIYRYPDRFDACRPGAFAAWSSTIVDNTIRRQLRRKRSGVDITLSPVEVLAQHADKRARGPARQAQDHEECERTLAAFGLLLRFYLAAFHCLTERERFVLQMVEVRQMRYAELAGILGIRPEALKMVVFRARKRVLERMSR
ncbi:MAG: membrane protein insertase YidC, partial [Pseudomonadota bacterium]